MVEAKEKWNMIVGFVHKILETKVKKKNLDIENPSDHEAIL